MASHLRAGASAAAGAATPITATAATASRRGHMLVFMCTDMRVDGVVKYFPQDKHLQVWLDMVGFSAKLRAPLSAEDVKTLTRVATPDAVGTVTVHTGSGREIVAKYDRALKYADLQLFEAPLLRAATVAADPECAAALRNLYVVPASRAVLYTHTPRKVPDATSLVVFCEFQGKLFHGGATKTPWWDGVLRRMDTTHAYLRLDFETPGMLDWSNAQQIEEEFALEFKDDSGAGADGGADDDDNEDNDNDNMGGRDPGAAAAPGADGMAQFVQRSQRSSTAADRSAFAKAAKRRSESAAAAQAALAQAAREEAVVEDANEAVRTWSAKDPMAAIRSVQLHDSDVDVVVGLRAAAPSVRPPVVRVDSDGKHLPLRWTAVWHDCVRRKVVEGPAMHAPAGVALRPDVQLEWVTLGPLTRLQVTAADGVFITDAFTAADALAVSSVLLTGPLDGHTQDLQVCVVPTGGCYPLRPVSRD